MKNSLVPIKTLDLESPAPHLQGREVWQQVQHLEKSGQFHFCCQLCVFVFYWYALYFLEGRDLRLWLLLSSSLDLLHPAGGKSMSVPFQWVIVHFLDQCSNIWWAYETLKIHFCWTKKKLPEVAGSDDRLWNGKNPSQLDFCVEVEVGNPLIGYIQSAASPGSREAC